MWTTYQNTFLCTWVQYLHFHNFQGNSILSLSQFFFLFFSRLDEGYLKNHSIDMKERKWHITLSLENKSRRWPVRILMNRKKLDGRSGKMGRECWVIENDQTQLNQRKYLSQWQSWQWKKISVELLHVSLLFLLFQVNSQRNDRKELSMNGVRNKLR